MGGIALCLTISIIVEDLWHYLDNFIMGGLLVLVPSQHHGHDRAKQETVHPVIILIVIVS